MNGRKMLKTGIHKNNKGMGLVEILCAVAIFSIVAATIATIVAVSAKTYRSGVMETSVQQEAQLAANRIGELIKNANTATTADGDTTLNIVANDELRYMVKQNSSNELIYVQETGPSASPTSSDQAILAENISNFRADVTNFDPDRIVKVSFDVTNNDRTYSMNYVMTARNEVVSDISTDINFVGVSYDKTIIMEPGQKDYVLDIDTVGNTGGIKIVTQPGVTLDPAGGVLPQETHSSVKITLDKSIVDDHIDLPVQTVVTNDDGTPKWSGSVSIKVRRTNDINLTYVVDTTGTVGSTMEGLMEGKGTKFTFYANITDQNSAKSLVSDGEGFANYISPKNVTWSIKVSLNNGTDYLSESAAAAYIKEVDGTRKETGVDKPSIEYEVMQDMPSGLMFIVTATSQHQSGANNKSGEMYIANIKNDDGTSEMKYEPLAGSITIGARETKIDEESAEITLEPNETKKYNINAVGAVSAVTVTVEGSTDSSTTAVYVPKSGSVTDYIQIKVGKNEKGTLIDGNYYTFLVKFNVNGVAKKTITVHVRRVDSIYIKKETPKSKVENGKIVYANDNNKWSATPVQDFKIRINTTESGQSDDVIKYLMNYGDSTDDKTENVKKTLAMEISWAIKDSSGTDTIDDAKGGATGTVRLYAGIEEATVTSDWTADDPNDNKNKKNTIKSTEIIEDGKSDIQKEDNSSQWYSLKNSKGKSSIKAPIIRIYKDEDGNYKKDAKGNLIYSMKQPPEIDFYMKAETPTGLPAGVKLVVTAKALHPYGTNGTDKFNRSGIPYYSDENDITDTYVLGGELSIDSNYVIVEPGQGSDYMGSANELAIPIYADSSIAASIAKMEVTIDGKDGLTGTDAGTKLAHVMNSSDGSEYLDGKQQNNPYSKDEKDASGNTKWWLSLLIGKYEKGDNGEIEVVVTAKDSDGNPIAAKTISLKLRQVNKVGLAVADNGDINKLNVSGSTITLKASPTGYGTSGVEYYAVQKDSSKNTCRWETEGHGEYKSPYTMKWTFIDSAGNETELSKMTDYIEIVQPAKTEGYTRDNTINPTYMYPDENDSVASDGHNAVISFKLKQPLPKGTIRATSLHSLGSVTAGGTKTDYNKSGTNYAEEDKGKTDSQKKVGVYGEITIGGGSITSAPFTRGQEYFFTGESVNDILPLAQAINQEKGIGSVEARFYYRVYNYTTGKWSPYYGTEEQGNPQKFCAEESLILLPNIEYDIEFIKVVSDPNNNVVYWPNGLAGKSGTGFDSYTQGTYKADDSGLSTTDYPRTYHMGIAKPLFDGKYNLGSMSSPINITGNYDAVITDVEKLNMVNSATSMRNWLFPMLVQKYVNGAWVDVDVSTICSQYDNATFKIHTGNPGLYRIGVGIKSKNFFTISGQLKNITRTSVSSPDAYALYSESENRGFMYLNIN